MCLNKTDLQIVKPPDAIPVIAWKVFDAAAGKLQPVMMLMYQTLKEGIWIHDEADYTLITNYLTGFHGFPHEADAYIYADELRRMLAVPFVVRKVQLSMITARGTEAVKNLHCIVGRSMFIEPVASS